MKETARTIIESTQSLFGKTKEIAEKISAAKERGSCHAMVMPEDLEWTVDMLASSCSSVKELVRFVSNDDHIKRGAYHARDEVLERVQATFARPIKDEEEVLKETLTEAGILDEEGILTKDGHRLLPLIEKLLSKTAARTGRWYL